MIGDTKLGISRRGRNTTKWVFHTGIMWTNFAPSKILSKWSKLIYTIYELEIEDRLKFEEGVKRAS